MIFEKSTIPTFFTVKTQWGFLRNSTNKRIGCTALKKSGMALDSDESRYLTKLRSIVDEYTGFNIGEPTELLKHLFIGNCGNATDVALLTSLGITHVVNCAASYTVTGTEFYGPSIQYLGLEAEDEEGYDILQHYNSVLAFINSAKNSNGRVLIHCQMGVNRSGALATAYMMKENHRGPLSVVKEIKSKRGMILENTSFQEQIVRFAKSWGLLELDKHLL